ncbi:MAG TPA: DUF4157 domain-containing protein, partial [Kofleriaceae bacterium]|nr:DUF4157 domain-containing protein [Kofleriaceae bacterium]
MSLELLNRRDDDVAWLALARSLNVSDEVARVLWARAKAESGQDPIKAERRFRRFLEDAQAIDVLAREIEANGDAGLLDPGKWTRVLQIEDLRGTSQATAAENALRTAKPPASESDGWTITDEIRKFGKTDVGKIFNSIESGTFQQLIRMVDALVTIVEHDRAQREGRELPTNIRSELEDKLGIDFSGVRIHDNTAAASQAKKYDAVAFARGKDVYFADGAYDPSSPDGKKLIAHELTHVAQQRDGGRAATGAMSEPGSAVEREADRVADAFGAGAARGAAAFQVQERAAAGTISRKGDAPAPAADAKPTKWKPNLFNAALDLSEELKLAKDIGGGHKEIKVGKNVGPLKIEKATFKQNEGGDKVESGTLHAAVDAGVFKGTTGQLKVDQNEGVSGKLNIPINAAGMFAKEVNIEVGGGEVTGKVRLDPSDFKSPHFKIKNSDFELSVTSKGGSDISAALIGTGQVEIDKGFASGLAQLDIDLKVHREQGVTFNARVAGKVAIAGLGEAATEIYWDGSKLTFNAGGTAPITLPGLEGIANFKYELGKFSLSSDSVRFTMPKLKPFAFSGVELGGENKLKARLDLESPILIPIPNSGGASVELEHSTIQIDGKKVEGELTGSFALNNAGGFKGRVNVGYTKEGGFKGSVGIAGGATFKVAGVQVTIENGSKLDVEKNADGFDVAGDLKAKAKIPGLPEINVAILAEHGKPIDLQVDTHIDLKAAIPQLKGDVHVKYQRGGGENAFSFDATDIGVVPAPLGGQVIFSQMSGHLKGGQLTGSLTAAAGTEITVGKTTKITILGGHIDLLPGKILDGHLKAKGEGGGGPEGGGTQAEATIGWNQGKFDWAAEGNFELKDLTNSMLLGSVHAAAGSNGTGNFVSNGPITFGNPLLKDVTIEHLTGNREEQHYEATISVEKAINKVVSQVPNVKVEAAKAAAVITYKDKKLSVNGEIGLKACYPATGEPQLEGTLFLGIDKDTGGFIGQLTGVNVKAGKYFESKGGHVDLKSGDVTLGTSTFDVPNIASGTVNHAHVNVKDKQFSIDLDVDLKVKALAGVKLSAHVDNDKITASMREDTPAIPIGTFASVKMSNGSNFEFSKEGGFTANVVATLDAPSVGTGTARLNYDKKLTGSAELNVKKFAMFDPIDVHLNFDEERKVSTVAPVKIALASEYATHFAAEAEINVDKNAYTVTGKVTELKNLGSVSEAFNGAQINYDSNSKRVTVDADIKIDKVVPQLAPGSTLHLAYADGVVNVDGVLKPKSFGTNVVFTETSQINAHWDTKTKRFTTVGGATATIADLCEVDFTVDAGLGGGVAGQFGLRGRIEAGKLAAKIPGISFSAVTADFSVLIASGQKTDLDFNLRAGINGIPAAGINDVDGYLQANFKTGMGINGEFGINHAKLGPVIADGKISVERGKFKQGSLHLVADFPKLKIEGTGTVSASEMGGLNTTADLKVTPAPETAIGKFVQSGNIHVDLVKWKVTNAVGELNLVPPSFLPLVDPKIIVSYKPEEGIKAALNTKFPAPMAKNGELGNFEVGYSQGKGLYAHIDFPLLVPGFQAATVTGDLDQSGVRIGVVLIPKNASLVKQASIMVGFDKTTGFYIEGKIRLKPTETMELEVGLRFDGKGLQVIGMEPDDKDATSEDHELAHKDFPFPTIPLLTVGVATLGLKFGMGISAGYRMPKIKFKNPQLEGGLDALDSGGMPSFTFGGSIAMGAYVALTLSVQIVGEIQLLICSASAGIGAEIMARLNLELGADVNGRYASGQGALITIDPYIAASLDLIASLIATLHAEIGWWTILDKKWTLASATFAHIDLGSFRPFMPIGLAFGGPSGTHLTSGMALRDDAFNSVTEGVKEGGKKSADNESNREAREKITPVLQAFKNAAPQFQELPPGWEKGMVAVPVDFNAMFPVEDKKWDFYQDHADQAEDMVPELRMNTPTERLAKAVAVTARKNPYAAGRLI